MRRRIHIAMAVASAALFLLLVAPTLEPRLDYHFQRPIHPLKVWQGLASWYGPRFQGQATASGQPYDMFAATAAHASLPFGSILQLTDLKTGRSQLVRINDRGPFVGERELDVSFAVAANLGLLDHGVDPVRIVLLEMPKHP